MPRSFSDFVLTSNRDEAPNRKTLPPDNYEVNDTKLMFPKDEIAGGTWIGVSNFPRMICLLNGGFEPHKRKDSYRLSRGVIVTDLLTAENAVESIGTYDFNDIEPFTIILIEWREGLQLYELVWDGAEAHFSEKPLTPHIWSSSLLYSTEVKKKRESWFSEFLFEDISPSEEALLEFHKTAGEGNIETNLIMDRGFVKTKSISQISKEQLNGTFRYEDLETNEITKRDF